MDTKTAIATLLIALALLTNISAERVRLPPPHIQECVTKEGVTLDEAVELGHEGNITLAETNPKYKCFLACAMKARNIIDDCNLIYVETMLKGENAKDPRNGGLNFCKDKVKSTERCECAYELYKCLLEFK